MKRNRQKSSQGPEPSSPDPPPPPTMPPPPIQWEEGAEHLGPIMRRNNLPLVVTCQASGLPNMDHVNFDLTQPLLLHTRRTVRKVLASSVMHVKRGDQGDQGNQGDQGDQGNQGDQGDQGGRLKEVGDCLLIPEDYKGWFAVLGHPNHIKPGTVVPHFRQAGPLALSKCETFLVGGRDPVSAFHMPHTESSATDGRARPRLVYPGEVLRMGKLYVGQSTVKVKKGGLFGGSKTVKEERKFLLCTDERDTELYLPVENRGTFYLLTTEGNLPPKTPILRLPDILARYRLPCVVKLLFGRVPSTPCFFTGMMTLREAHTESSVIGSTMLNLHNILLDVPIDSDLRFFLAANTSELLASRAYKNAKALCEDKASTYMRNMKVAYFVNDERDAATRHSREHADVPDTRRRLSERSRSSVLSRHTPTVVEDQPLFCPQEAAPSPVLPSPSQKKARRSIQDSDATSLSESLADTSSPTGLRKDATYNLPPPAETLPLRTTMSSPALSRHGRQGVPVFHPSQSSDTLRSAQYMNDTSPNVQYLKDTPPRAQYMNDTPPNAQYLKDTPPSAQYMNDTAPSTQYMSMEDTAPGAQYMSMNDTASQPPQAPGLGTKTPPPTPPKPRKAGPPAHGRRDASLYVQAWDGGSKLVTGRDPDYDVQYRNDVDNRGDVVNSGDVDTGVTSRPARLDVPAASHRMSGLALEDTYLTFFPDTHKRSVSNADSQPPPSPRFSTTISIKQSETTIYKTPLSSQRPDANPQRALSSDDQPYEDMSSVNRHSQPGNQHGIHHGNQGGSGKQQRPPTPPPKTNQRPPVSRSSHFGIPTSLPPVPPIPWDSSFKGITFVNRSSLFSDSSSAQECSYASRMLSQQQDEPTQDQADPTYIPMRRESYTYYEGCNDEDELVAGDSDTPSTDHTFFQDRAALDGGVSSEDVQPDYENVEKLRLYRHDKVTPSNSVDSDHGQFFDRFENPPAIFGYVTPPHPRPMTSKTPPPVPKKPGVNTGQRGALVHSTSGDDEARAPPRPCTLNDNPKSGYLHPIPDRAITPTTTNNNNTNTTNNNSTTNNYTSTHYNSTTNSNYNHTVGYVQQLGSPYSPPLPRAHVVSQYSDMSGSSVEDDLPLGATFSTFQTPVSDSGCALESEAGGGRRHRLSSHVSSLSVAELGEALLGVGLMQDCVDTLQRTLVDGKLLASMNEELLMETLPNVKKIDLKKIQMFVAGWRPKE